LTAQQFYSQFGPTAATVAQVTKHFQAAGLQVAQLTGTYLSVTGSTAAIQKEFAVQLHAFEVPATTSTPGFRFRSPIGSPQIAAAIADSVQAVYGFDTRPHYRPHLTRSTALPANAKLVSVKSSGAPASAGAPGSLTVTDFAKHYDVDPLYRDGLSGRGVTIGIVTLASFTPSDAFAYWDALGLTVSPGRIQEIQVDGGSGAPSDASGSLETTIDVEQSGGLSPGAKIEVYEAPNTDQAFIDAFAKAIDSNRADTLSSSWGQWEFFDLTQNGGGVNNPNNGRPESSIQAFNNLFAQAALQGQSFYIAAGDAGAYDETDNFVVPSYPPPKHSVVLSVDDPGVQQWVTDMGGTTLPGTQTFAISATQNLSIDIPTEQAWGWDYLTPLCTALGLDPISCGTFPGGGGGGVSSYVPLPIYQWGIPGIQRTAPGQTLLDYSQTPPAFVVTLPSGFAGRNVPDISLNADPYTGYAVYYTSNVSGFGIQTGWGGTSFCAPEFNGVTALFDQSLHHRVGLLNFALYNLVREGIAYRGANAPLRDITAGDNWHYDAHQGYDQASGLGVPDVAHLLEALSSPWWFGE
jgi:subtilase family serine protease